MEPMNEQVLAALIRMAAEGDMNAAQAVEGELELRGMADKYAGALLDEVGHPAIVDRDGWLDRKELFKVVHATAAQRASAALKALNVK